MRNREEGYLRQRNLGQRHSAKFMARLNGYDWEKKGLEEALPQGVGGYRGERWQLDTDTQKKQAQTVHKTMYD